MPPNLAAHLKWGAAAAIALLAAVLLGMYAHPSASLLIGGALMAWAVERYQAVRGEGVPSDLDMAATFAPFGALALLTWALC